VTRVSPVVMSAPGVTPLRRVDGAEVEMVAAYRGAGSFAPALADNLRAATWLAARSRAAVWHFVFAPNPRSSGAGRMLKRLRRVPVVQTVASPPREFRAIETLLFGDVVVAQSRWTRANIQSAAEREGVAVPRVEVIPPPVAELERRSLAARRELRAALEVAPDAPLFVYPGDLEVSGGAEMVARAVDPIVRSCPEAVVVFAYRAKTPKAHDIARDLKARLPARHVRVESELSDVLVLIQQATAVLFPVDDLWGKVDLPIVLLESMSLGVPVVALDHGPLSDLAGVVHTKPDDLEGLVAAALRLGNDDAYRQGVIEGQRKTIDERHRAAVVARAYEDLYLELAEEKAP
jgi:phosphatidylinositol alpha-1,6-mannosyltransferase